MERSPGGLCASRSALISNQIKSNPPYPPYPPLTPPPISKVGGDTSKVGGGGDFV